jgi:hypothetical protein
MATVPEGWDEMLANMRKFSKGGGIGFFVVRTKSRGPIPIWIEDINRCDSDEQLVDLILKCISD